MENLNKQISPTAMKQLKQETDEFLNNIQQNEILKNSEVVPDNKESLSDTIADTVLFGGDVELNKKFSALLESLKLNFTQIIIDNLFLTVKNNKTDFKAFVNYLNKRKKDNSVGFDLNEINKLSITDISAYTRYF